MNATLLFGAARVLVAISTVAAHLAHAWLTVGHPWLPQATLLALLLGAAGGWLWRRGAQYAIFGLAHVWPLITFFAIGLVEPLALGVWLAALTSMALATTPWTRWSLPRRWQVPVAAWGVLLSLGWPIVLARELDFTLITYSLNQTTQGLGAGPLRDTLALMVGFTTAILSAIVVLDWLWAYYSLPASAVPAARAVRGGVISAGRRRPFEQTELASRMPGPQPGEASNRPPTADAFYREVAAPLAAGTVIALGIGVYQGTVDLGWLNADPWLRLGRATGTLFDANAFGAVAALWAAPVAGAAMVAEHRAWRAVGPVLLLLAAVAVWACGSRTALLGLLSAFAGIAVALARAGRLSRVVSAVAVLGIVATITVGWVIGGPGSALRRTWQTLPAPSIESVTRFAHAMWTRDGYGAAAVDMLREHPLTGIGPGAFPLFATDYASGKAPFPIPPDNAQNWWRHQLTEIGLVAGAVPIAASVLLLAATLGTLRRNRPNAAAVAGGAMIGTGLMSLVGSPVAHPIVLITITVLIFWVTRSEVDSGSTGSTGSAGSTGSRGLALLVVWALPIAWAAGTAWVAVNELRPPYRAETVGWVYAYGVSEAEDLGNGVQRRWVMHRSVGVVPSVGTRLVMTFRPAPETAASGPIGVRVFTRERTLLDQTLNGEQSATTAVDFNGREWTMVQIETSRRGVVVDGFERALQLTTKFE